jgi:aldehyde dehydrogenase (NAD+)
VIRARNLNDAIEQTNAISFGLSAGVVTNNMKNAFAFANAVDAGVIKINEPTTGLALNAPFGGFKHSSANTFKEQGQAAMDFYNAYKDHLCQPRITYSTYRLMPPVQRDGCL